jgi:hypothetical protein
MHDAGPEDRFGVGPASRAGSERRFQGQGRLGEGRTSNWFLQDNVLQSQATATLSGLGTRNLKSFERFNASAVAFDPTGKRVLIGGLDKESVKIWNSATDELYSSKLSGSGPVAWGKDGTPSLPGLPVRCCFVCCCWRVVASVKDL